MKLLVMDLYCWILFIFVYFGFVVENWSNVLEVMVGIWNVDDLDF